MKGLDLDGKIGWMSEGRIEIVECDCFSVNIYQYEYNVDCVFLCVI